MATSIPALVPIEKYLNTMYHPDRDFADGQIEKRNLGEFDHARLRILLASWLANHEAEWNIVTLTEQRVRVTESRVRIPDICALRSDAPYEPVTQTPPLLCVEVLSPKDRLSRTIQVMDDYLRMGVQHLWVIDPIERIAYTFTAAGLLRLQGDHLAVAGTPIYLNLSELFAKLPKK